MRYTKSGCVFGEGGGIVGSYERVIDYQQTEAGPLNEMIITLFARPAAVAQSNEDVKEG